MKQYLFILLIVAPLPAYTVEIENFKSGLACTDGETFGWICYQIEKIYVTGQGKCTYNNEVKPCTWHGFEFDYTDLEKDTVIECKISISELITLGNPDEITDKEITKTTYVLPVEPGSGHFFNPQYQILTLRSKPPYSTTAHTACYANKIKLFEFSNQYVYPSKP